MSKKRLWGGRVLSALPAIFMLTSGINLALIQTTEVRASFAKFGYSEGIVAAISRLQRLINREIVRQSSSGDG